MGIGGGIGLGISLSDCNHSFFRHTFYDPNTILLRPAHYKATSHQNDHASEDKHQKEEDGSGGQEVFTEKEQDAHAAGGEKSA